jgi:hypothetical protein
MSCTAFSASGPTVRDGGRKAGQVLAAKQVGHDARFVLIGGGKLQVDAAGDGLTVGRGQFGGSRFRLGRRRLGWIDLGRFGLRDFGMHGFGFRSRLRRGAHGGGLDRFDDRALRDRFNADGPGFLRGGAGSCGQRGACVPSDNKPEHEANAQQQGHQEEDAEQLAVPQDEFKFAVFVSSHRIPLTEGISAAS